MKTEYISELHSRYTQWKKDLEFYRDEIRTFNTRLEELVSQNTKTEVTAQIEHFQNQFIRQNEVIDTLEHDIHAEEHKLAENAQANTVAVEHRKVEENTDLGDQFETFVKIYNELKNEFTEFMAKTY
ncbi:MAG: hypothetical protein GC181_12265 [Bacteroidetes bacterium]|nr:hypothetical protein [Bacteroidota bacterium]